MHPRTGAAIAVILIPFGALVAWGGISGNLAAILAALFAQHQLVPIGGSIPPLIQGAPIPVGPPPVLPGGGMNLQ